MLECHDRGHARSAVHPAPLAALVLAGCAVGGPQVGPQTATGYHTTQQFHFVTGNAQLGGTGYSESHESQSSWGLLFGAKAGVASVSLGGVGAPAHQAVDIHFDGMYSIGRFGLALSTSYGAESASLNGQDYSLAGLGLAVFGQYSLTDGLFVKAGLGRMFWTNISRSQQTGDRLTMVNDAEVGPLRAFAGLTWIFSSSTTTQWGIAAELRLTRTGDASINDVDVQWSSVSLMGELLYIKF